MVILVSSQVQYFRKLPPLLHDPGVTLISVEKDKHAGQKREKQRDLNVGSAVFWSF